MHGDLCRPFNAIFCKIVRSMLERGPNCSHGRIVGGAPSCPGQLPKGVLMDAQTVIAVCELLLVVVALIDLVGRRDE